MKKYKCEIIVKDNKKNTGLTLLTLHLLGKGYEEICEIIMRVSNLEKIHKIEEEA